ncbi:MAG: LarC family nickel insertion protein [Pelotomaculum sp.]|nr:LarC family nickel insertion protein [Pelotomaculum sp.]
MKVIYFGCQAGVSGESLLGALAGLFADPGALIEKIKRLVGKSFNLEFKKCPVGGISACETVLALPGSEREVAVTEFAAGIKEGCSGNPVTEAAAGILFRFAGALARLKGVPESAALMKEEELLRILVISAGYFAALQMLEIEKVTADPVPVALSGTGELLEEALALELLRGARVRPSTGRTAVASPLGACLLAASAEEFGLMPEMAVSGTGYGLLSGSGKEAATPAVAGFADTAEKEGAGRRETVTVLEASIDDMNPEFYPYVIERLLAAGALDAFMAPIYMKKGRPACLLTVLCRSKGLEEMLQIIFRETTTLGVRIREEERRVLERCFFSVETPYGAVKVKAGYAAQGGLPVQMAPEFEDCRKIAAAKGVPLKEVYAAAQREAYKTIKGAFS